MEKTIGEKLSPILAEIEDTLWEYEANCGLKPDYTMDGFKAGCKIFMSVLMDKMFERQRKEHCTQESSEKEAEMLGYKIRALLLEHAGIDTHELYKP